MGTTPPGQNFIYLHLNRVTTTDDLDMIYVAGPGHGGAAVVANTYPGLQKLFLQFSFPGGDPQATAHRSARGRFTKAACLVVAGVVGDGEAETGPLATAWHSNKFLNPATDGAVPPIPHLNGYNKIANPTILARIEPEELDQLLRGYGQTPIFVEGHDPELMHEATAAALDTAVRS